MERADPNQVMAMQGMGDEEAMMNLAIALSLNEVGMHVQNRTMWSVFIHLSVMLGPIIVP